MALWMFTLTENSAERTYLHSLEGEIYHKSLSWEIKDGELIISGDWNESFVLDLNAKGEELEIVAIESSRKTDQSYRGDTDG